METLALALHFPTVANPLFFFFFGHTVWLAGS